MRVQQRRIGLAGSVIMVGRDIGTVVLPEASLKIYLDASLPVRAHRRVLERRERGEPVDEQRVLDEMRQRDRIDSTRQHAPLMPAKDAIVVDSTDLTIDQVIERMHLLIRRWGAAVIRTRVWVRRSHRRPVSQTRKLIVGGTPCVAL